MPLNQKKSTDFNRRERKKKTIPGDNCTSLVLAVLLVDVHSFCTWATTLNSNGLACTISVRRLTL